MRYAIVLMALVVLALALGGEGKEGGSKETVRFAVRVKQKTTTPSSSSVNRNLKQKATPNRNAQLYMVRRKKKKQTPTPVVAASSSVPSSAIKTKTRFTRPIQKNTWKPAGQVVRAKTPIMVNGGLSSAERLRSNIPLPHNPFMGQNVEVSLQEGAGETEEVTSPLNTFVDETHSPVNTNSRADSWLSSLSSISSMSLPMKLFNGIAGRFKASHYTKPGSGSSLRSPLSTTYKTSSYSYYRPPSASTSASAESIQSSVKVPPTRAPSRDTLVKLLSKLQHIEKMKEAFPPHGAFTPYGERTIIMVKYPGLPERQRVRGNDLSVGPLGSVFKLGGIKSVTITKDDWSSPSQYPVKVKDSDYGVIISQNYVLQPDTSMNSPYHTGGDYYQDEGEQEATSTRPSANLISQLATALAERNQIINSQARKGQGKKQPPFVLVHLETFTKKTNKTTPFGFDEEIETNYANGTIIYPTLEDPTVLASTKFEFENVEDVENVFDRPLAGYNNGEMKPIVPLGLIDIQNYLRLMFEVHKDIHDGGKAKVDELKNLSYVVERHPLEEGKSMSKAEAEHILRRYKDNWLHTSTIGVRSLSDYPPPPPKLPVPYPINSF